MTQEKKKQVALYLTDAQNDTITEYANKVGVTRQKLMSNMIDNGIDELKAMERYGILAVGVGVRDLLYKLKAKGVTPESLADGQIIEQS